MATCIPWKAAEFERGATRLVTILACAASTGSSCCSSNGTTMHWSLDGNGGICLRIQTTPPCTTKLPNSKATDDSETRLVTDEILSQEPLWMDRDVVASAAAGLGANDQDTPLSNRTIRRDWHLSILYSPVWQVPVLYFDVQKQESGGNIMELTTCTSRQDVLEDIIAMMKRTSVHPQGEEEKETENDCTILVFATVLDLWDVCTFEEHPITGMPSLFLHPCQFEERLRHLLDARYPQPQEENECASLTKNGATSFVAIRIWTWLAMILPAMGLTSIISPQAFELVLRQLERSRENET